MLHAVGPGLFLYEIQEASDTTFRVYDWDRPQSAGRKLHIEESVEVTLPLGPGPLRRPRVEGETGMAKALDCAYFDLDLVRVSSTAQSLPVDTAGLSFHFLTVIEGAAEVRRGDRTTDAEPARDGPGSGLSRTLRGSREPGARQPVAGDRARLGALQPSRSRCGMEDVMKVGVMIPQGWKYEYNGWDPAVAWARTIELARDAEALGFESEWVFDHFHTVPDVTDEITFESFTTLTAISGVTSRVRIGHMVICTGFRNPALVAKLAATLDVASGGRFELGIGGGLEGRRVARLRLRLSADQRAAGGTARRSGSDHADVRARPRHLSTAASPEWRRRLTFPKALQQPRPPIIVGGNGQDVTWRLAARIADELNLVFLSPDEIAEEMPIVRARCEEFGRDPATLAALPLRP